MNKLIIGLLFFVLPCSLIWGQMRVKPYLIPGDEKGNLRITWFTETNEAGKLILWEKGKSDSIRFISQPQFAHELYYSKLEEEERAKYPDMFKGSNWKHSLILNTVSPSKTYQYKLIQGKEIFENSFQTAPLSTEKNPIRIVAIADSETDYEGRLTHRNWSAGAQHPQSTGRPKNLTQYPITETEGFKANLKYISQNNPDFILLAGDIVQGGAYQRAWDEFFFHTAGKFDEVLGRIPLFPAIGNWENFGARNGGYEPSSIRNARGKYKSYFSLPENNSDRFQDAFYRVDYGFVTVLTLDSSNGEPDNTDDDTNVNIDLETYPANDIPDINPGSEQWNWVEAQLKDAQEKGQVILVQFHHIPYSSGGHILPLTAEGSSGQAGIPMRKYTPLFKKYGVVAVICGHNESLEHSVVEGIHFWDVGIAGDGIGQPDSRNPRKKNEFSQWTVHFNSAELWSGNVMKQGGKHYGHLVIDILPVAPNQYEIKMTPYHIFPELDNKGNLMGISQKVYEYSVSQILHLNQN